MDVVDANRAREQALVFPQESITSCMRQGFSLAQRVG